MATTVAALRTSPATTGPDSIDKDDPRRDVVKRAIFAEVGNRLGRTCVARIATRVLADIDTTLAQGPAVQLPTRTELARRYALLNHHQKVTNSDYQAATEALELVQRAPAPASPRERAAKALREQIQAEGWAEELVGLIEAAGLRIVDAEPEGGEQS